MNNNIEHKLTYKLIKVKNSRKERDVYRAVLRHDALTPEETMSEIVHDTRAPAYQIESIVSGVLDSMICHTLADGRTRKFGEWFETRLDIEGNFDRIDADFDKTAQKVVINLLPLARFGQYRRKTPPENEQIRPSGRIDYVTYPGGDKGEIKFGEDILIYGHDLTLSDYDTLLLRMDTKGTPQNYVVNLHIKPGEEQKIIEHDDTHIRVKWFGCEDPSLITNRQAIFYFNPWTRVKREPWEKPGRGSCAHVTIVP